MNEAMGERADLPRVPLEPDPVIEAYKKDVDRTWIRENPKLSTGARRRKMIAELRLVEEVRRTRGATA